MSFFRRKKEKDKPIMDVLEMTIGQTQKIVMCHVCGGLFSQYNTFDDSVLRYRHGGYEPDVYIKHICVHCKIEKDKQKIVAS
jgi:hypothetical protein